MRNIQRNGSLGGLPSQFVASSPPPLLDHQKRLEINRILLRRPCCGDRIRTG